MRIYLFTGPRGRPICRGTGQRWCRCRWSKAEGSDKVQVSNLYISQSVFPRCSEKQYSQDIRNALLCRPTFDITAEEEEEEELQEGEREEAKDPPAPVEATAARDEARGGMLSCLAGGGGSERGGHKEGKKDKKKGKKKAGGSKEKQDSA